MAIRAFHIKKIIFCTLLWTVFFWIDKYEKKLFFDEARFACNTISFGLSAFVPGLAETPPTS